MTKPPAEKRVLAWDGKQWVRAIWVEKYTKEQDTDSEFHNYLEASDTYYWPEGWYEVQTHGGEEMFWHITEGVQEWQEMPAAPGASDHLPDAGKMVDEAAMTRLTESGRKAWAELDGKSATAWVDEIRGNADHVPDANKKVGQDCEPFGYFRPEPFGWTDCAETDEGAVALYERPQFAQDCEPIYQWRMNDWQWVDQTRSIYYSRVDAGEEKSRLRIVYAAQPKR